MPDNTVNIENGKYTTCDETDHPHFYLAMTKAKVIPGARKSSGAGLPRHGGRADLLSRHPRGFLPDCNLTGLEELYLSNTTVSDQGLKKT